MVHIFTERETLFHVVLTSLHACPALTLFLSVESEMKEHCYDLKAHIVQQ